MVKLTNIHGRWYCLVGENGIPYFSPFQVPNIKLMSERVKSLFFFFLVPGQLLDALIMHKLESCMILSCPSHGQCPLWARHAAVLAAHLNPVLMTNVWNNSVGPLNHQLSSAAISISITTTTTTGSRPFKVTPWMSRVAVPTSSDVTPPVSRDHRRRRRQGGDLLGASSSSSSCCW